MNNYEHRLHEIELLIQRYKEEIQDLETERTQLLLALKFEE